MATISVLIIARNEEKNISDCLDSVKNFADEIIVIDDFSTDRTVEICKNHGAKIFQRALEGNFGAQKNFAIEQASCDWIFIIDADERATPELAAEIKKIVAEDNKKFAWKCARLSCFFGKYLRHGGWFPDYVTRLLPRIGTSVQGLVHEKIIHSCVEKKISTDKYLIHHTYRNWENYFSKMNNYSALMAKKMHDEGKTANFLDIIGRPCWAFLRMYILRGGFLDGLLGFVMAAFNSVYVMQKYVKLYYLGK